MNRIVVVGGPRRGKSTLAQALHKTNPRLRRFCGDPLSKVKEPLVGVSYLPEGLGFSGDFGAAVWVARNWFTMPGPWICEGHVMARALRRWLAQVPGRMPCDKIIVLDRPAFGESLPGQEAMHKGVMSVWDEIAPFFASISRIERK